MEVDWEQEIGKIVGEEDVEEVVSIMAPMIPLWNNLLEKAAEGTEWPQTGDLLKVLMSASCRILPRFEDVLVGAALSKQVLMFTEGVLDKKMGVSQEEIFTLKLRVLVDAMSFMYAAGYIHAVTDKALGKGVQAEFVDKHGGAVTFNGDQIRKVIGEHNFDVLFNAKISEDEVGD